MSRLISARLVVLELLWPHLARFGAFLVDQKKRVTDGPTDGPTDGLMDPRMDPRTDPRTHGPTDTPSYRVVTHD